jgi:predicted ArsR family transcriptional regulator
MRGKRQLPVATISAAGMRIIRLMVGKPPVSISELIRAMGVTRTAITEQLNELIAAGFVERTLERLPGRGRPRHLYALTANALLVVFTSHQQLIVPAIWRAVGEIGGPELTRKVIKKVSQSLVDYYRTRVSGESVDDRLRQLAEVLGEEGQVIDMVRRDDGSIVLSRRSCSFLTMFEENRSICRIDQNVVSTVLGVPVRQLTCRHDGAPCCSFETPQSAK